MADPRHPFADYLARHLALIDDAVIARVPAGAPTSEQSADLDAYLYAPLTRFITSGGKRTRPALCLLGAEAVGADPSSALSFAAAIELFQAAALIHDDIADEGELRRGLACMHRTEGTGIAINAGDAALVAATSAIVRDGTLTAQARLALVDELCRMEERTLEGQALDLGWVRDGRWDVHVDDYLYMASHKTAYYSAAVPLAGGAICGGGSAEQVEGLRSFGMRCGLAFQIQDDLLNLVGDGAAQGKDFLSDITEGKRTLVMVWALEHLDERSRQELIGILSGRRKDPASLGRAVALAEEAGALAHAKTYARSLVEQAKQELDGADIAKDAREVLRSMADYFVERNS